MAGRTLGCEGGEEIILAGCECWVDVWETAFCAGVVGVVSRDRGEIVSSEDLGALIGDLTIDFA